LRKAFTLIELLVVIAVMGLMVAVGVSSVGTGQKFARLRGATRNVFAVIRNARSQALVTQVPVVVTYSNETVDEEPAVKIELKSEKMFTAFSATTAATLSGYPLEGGVAADDAVEDGGDSLLDPDKGGDTLEESLFAPLSSEVVKGIMIKVVKEDDIAYDSAAKNGRSKISVFSNVDYLDRKFSPKKDAAGTTAESGNPAKETSAGSSDEEAVPPPVRVLWQTNGRTDPHRVWVYAAGSDPESGLSIRIDRFGAAKVLEPGEYE
jgi:prepilin-type N-terminal cleavage/methylation domain-containing protein